MDPFVNNFPIEKLLKNIHVYISGWIFFFISRPILRTTEFVPRISFWIRVPFCCRFIRNRRFENVDTRTRIYIKELSNAKNRVELEIPSPSSPPFSKRPPERKQMAWRISRSTGNYQMEGIPWVIKRTSLFPAEKRPFVRHPYVYTLSWNRLSTDLSAKRIGLASFGKPDRAWLYSALILTFVRIPSIEQHVLRENSSSLSGR